MCTQHVEGWKMPARAVTFEMYNLERTVLYRISGYALRQRCSQALSLRENASVAEADFVIFNSGRDSGHTDLWCVNWQLHTHGRLIEAGVKLLTTFYNLP